MKINDTHIGKSVTCGEEWYGGRVYYLDIYSTGTKYFAKHKIYYNPYTKRVDDEYWDQELFVPFGFEVVDNIDILTYSI